MHQPKNRMIACLLALTGIILPGLHKFYLGQIRWGLVYFVPGLLWATFPIAMLARVASLCDALIYLAQGDEQFNLAFNAQWQAASSLGAEPEKVSEIAKALRQLDGLRQEGLITDYEFEQQRRQLLG
jgi:TM2 domain-containing membrane protein YozV